ncbi:unnamed protein product [Lactuca virosa]|uniref:Uncharacterized protein n=1 Tax=Lactuca virosa TaxID=75947 RepID=A0AAU9NR21_9ASTR|nr:unnamed protein product [Lactuca virosa]
MYKIETLLQVRLVGLMDVGVPIDKTDLEASDTSFFQGFHIPTKINKDTVEIINPIKFTKNAEIGLVLEKYKDSMIILFMDMQLKVDGVGLLRKEVEMQEEALNNSSKTNYKLEWATRKHQHELERTIANLRVAVMETKEYGLGSIEIGCVMAYNRHTNNCYASMASHQGGSVRFPSMPSHVVNYISHDDEMVSSTWDQLGYTKKRSMSMRFHTWFHEK